MNERSVLKLGWLTWLLLGVLLAITACKPENTDPGDNWEKLRSEAAYEVYAMEINTDNGSPVISKDEADYLYCEITISGINIPYYQATTGMIRGRGNSSWLWYDKKPYRIKLFEKQKILGLDKNSDWVLLANYRDPTDLMHAFGFITAEWLGIRYPNHSRFVELTLNGDYVGLYQLTEQIEQGGNRVNVDETGGLLMSLDLDDGPGLSPQNSDNFWSSVYRLPVCIKHPKYLSVVQLETIQRDFARLENAIKNFDYEGVDSLMDIPSLINYLILQELVYNVEIDAPRSVFLFRDKGGKYTMGPAWDFDAGFDFDWGTMTTGHHYFMEQELVLGTDPVKHTRGYRVSGFFTDLFRNTRFVSEYQQRWLEVKDSILLHSWAEIEKYEVCLQDAKARDFERWPIDRSYTQELENMYDWLEERIDVLTSVIAQYPAGEINREVTDCGTIRIEMSLSHELGYHQEKTVDISEDDLLSKLEITQSELYGPNLNIVPLRTDGSVGENFTNGIFGGWFEEDNNPGYWSNGHVYIEVFEDLTHWNCGIRADEGYCEVGDQHQVSMQYQFAKADQLKTVTVTIVFTIEK